MQTAHKPASHGERFPSCSKSSGMTPGVAKLSMLKAGGQNNKKKRPRKGDPTEPKYEAKSTINHSTGHTNKRISASPNPSHEDESILACEESFSDFGGSEEQEEQLNGESSGSEDVKEVVHLKKESEVLSIAESSPPVDGTPKRYRKTEPVQLITQLRLIESDAECCTEIFRYMTQREKLYQPRADYLNIISHLEPNMRSILYDWMMEVSQEFSLGRESMHLAVNYVDRMLSKCTLRTEEYCTGTMETEMHTKFIHRGNLQLLGVTCLFIASKLEEIYPPNCPDFANTTADTYNVSQIEEMEQIVLRNLDWQLNAQTLCAWFKIYVKLACIYISRNMPESPEKYNLLRIVLAVDTCTRVMELLDMTVIDIQFLRFYPSAITASAIYIRVPELRSMIQYFTNYTCQDLEPFVAMLFNYDHIPHRGMKPTSKPYFDLKINPEDMHTCQFHHSGNLEYVRSVAHKIKQASLNVPLTCKLSPPPGAFVEMERRRLARLYSDASFQFPALPTYPGCPQPDGNTAHIHFQNHKISSSNPDSPMNHNSPVNMPGPSVDFAAHTQYQQQNNNNWRGGQHIDTDSIDGALAAQANQARAHTQHFTQHRVTKQ